MARIKINDIPKDRDISKDEMRRVSGGFSAAGSDAGNQLMNATQQMQEMNMSFNLQYLELQNKMQGDNRQFTMMSNIMKTKHDTAKNAINNVR